MEYIEFTEAYRCENCNHFIRFYVNVNGEYLPWTDGRCGIPARGLRAAASPGCCEFSLKKFPNE